MNDKQRRGEQFTAHLNVHNVDTDTLAIGLEPGELVILMHDGTSLIIQHDELVRMMVQDGKLVMLDEDECTYEDDSANVGGTKPARNVIPNVVIRDNRK